MSAMSVSKSYLVLRGLESYVRTKNKLVGLGKGVRNAFGGGGGGKGDEGGKVEGGKVEGKGKGGGGEG